MIWETFGRDSHKGEKRRAFTMEFIKTVAKFAMENSNRKI